MVSSYWRCNLGQACSDMVRQEAAAAAGQSSYAMGSSICLASTFRSSTLAYIIALATKWDTPHTCCWLLQQALAHARHCLMAQSSWSTSQRYVFCLLCSHWANEPHLQSDRYMLKDIPANQW